MCMFKCLGVNVCLLIFVVIIKRALLHNMLDMTAHRPDLGSNKFTKKEYWCHTTNKLIKYIVLVLICDSSSAVHRRLWLYCGCNS
jgi:hypothetical protein